MDARGREEFSFLSSYFSVDGFEEAIDDMTQAVRGYREMIEDNVPANGSNRELEEH